MYEAAEYESPLGTITIESDGKAVTGLWIEGQHPLEHVAKLGTQMDYAAVDGNQCEAISLAKAWLDLYFAGQQPDFTPPLRLEGTKFQLLVWSILQKIPYGTTKTYGEIAKEIESIEGKARMSAQAVGGAVGSNPIAIIVPCHRVMGADGRLTGYQGGVHLKTALLETEGIDTSIFH